ncbi:hypothetical protein AX14_009652 [Amanita brunnescens Koide BX004]|nr:hypothetical protein AX14_009652 [Amanita brunnescens Koide BX004]
MPQHNPDGAPLQSLLFILKDRKSASPIKSVVNRKTIDLVHKLLFMKDYVNIAHNLRDVSDVKDLLDFVLFLLLNGHLSNSDASRRARRFMFKVITNTPVIPGSLFVTGISMNAQHEIIGGGGFGLVFKGKLGKAPVALKVLYKTHNNVDFCREALMWRSLNHQFVLPFLGIYETESASQFFLVSPYMKNGTLSQWRKKANRSTAEIENLISEVAQGIEYIHSEGVVHGDLRGDNVLLDANFRVKIADFGLTRYSESTVTHSGALHYNFAAPEPFG